MEKRQFIKGFCILFFLHAGMWLFGQRLQIGGDDFLVTGINIPWRFYGQDFGGRGPYEFDGNFFADLFQEFSNAGINTVRIWVHCDGRLSPVRDASSEITGLPGSFLDNLDEFLALAAGYDLMVIPVLWSFEMVDTRLIELVRDPAKLQTYFDHALIPILQRTEKYCNILAWEVINEPEWSMDIPFAGTSGQLVSQAEMQRFVGLHAEVIHRNSSHHVTVGSAGLRFLSDINFLTRNYWSDLELQKHNPGCFYTYLDFYTVHYYDWKWERFSPFKHDVHKLLLDKPTILSEFAFDEGDAPRTLLRRAIENGYAGLLPWSAIAADGIARWKDYHDHMLELSVDFHHMMPEAPFCLKDDLSESFHVCALVPNPASSTVTLQNTMQESYPLQVELVSMQGQTVKKWTGKTDTDMTIPLHDLVSGLYLVRFLVGETGGTIRELNRQKLLVLH